MIAALLAAAVFASPADHVRIDRPAGAEVSRDLGGRPLMTGGWRLVWSGMPVGPGRGVVRFTIRAAPADGVGTVEEMLQIGVGGAGTARDCASYGIASGDERRLPDRVINGRRWTAWANGDAGMSQQVSATELRAVHRGRCYAVERIRYAAKAGDAVPGLPPQARAAAAMDRALASLKLS